MGLLPSASALGMYPEGLGMQHSDAAHMYHTWTHDNRQKVLERCVVHVRFWGSRQQVTRNIDLKEVLKMNLRVCLGDECVFKVGLDCP